MTLYRHLVLSPHYDDAVLSIGGSIAKWADAGEPVLVMTVCTAIPDPDTEFSPFAEQNHESWGLSPDEAYRVRNEEDAAALAVLGADGAGLGFLDAIYRLPLAYESNHTLFGAVDSTDTLAEELQTVLGRFLALYPDAVTYAPLGIGYHVDHQQVFAAARELELNGATVRYYEDIPYLFEAGAEDRRLSEISDGLRDVDLLPNPQPVAGAFERKIAAIACYPSQLENLFKDKAAMPAIMRDRSRITADGPVEQTWSFSTRP